MLQQFIDWDTSLMLWLNGPHSHFCDGLMLMSTSTYTWIPLLLVLIVLIYRNYGWKPTLFILLGMAVALFFADKITVQLLRPFFHRMRPANTDNPISSQIYIVANQRGGRYGFPSAHAANAFAFALYFILVLRRRAVTILLLLWAFYLCYTRIYLGRHYPGDLLAGALVGMAGAVLSYYLLRTSRQYTCIQPLRGEKYLVLAAVLTLGVLAVIAPFLPNFG